MTGPEVQLFAKGRYQVESRLGEGGMGVVYRVHDRELDVRVALKTLRRIDPAAIYRFKREFRALADISHPNLVTLHELVCEDDRWFFTMELVDGVNFRDHVEGDEARLRAALRGLAEGVDALHQNGRFHRDIKPSNVLVTREGRVVLLDFGLVTMLAEESIDPDRAGVVGTVSYMSPEQGAGIPITAASDWYSVGVMMFEALTGVLPFIGQPFEILAAKQTSDAPRAGTIAPSCPSDLEVLAAELLQRSPKKRPAGGEVARRLGGAAPPPRSKAELMLVGRGPHLRQLHDAYLATKSGRTVVAHVRGDSGQGKSVLVRRFLEEVLEKEAPLVLSGRCYERESVPFKALDDVIDALSRHLMRLDQKDVSSLVSTDVLHLARMFPVLRRIRDIKERGETRSLVQEPQQHRRRAFRALRSMLARLSRARSVIIAIDDLQWGDLDSVQLIADLLRPPDPPPILLVACHRSEDERTSIPLSAFLDAPKDRAHDVREIAIEPLNDDEALELVAAVLKEEGGPPVGPADRTAIVREARGNPFVIDELARHVRRAREAAPIPERPIRYEDALEARIARLSDRACTLLERVCVSGRPILQRVALKASEGGGDNQAALVMLLAEHLIRTRIFGETEALEAYHDRVREAVLVRLSGERLAEHHRALARALLDLDEPDHEALVEHFEAVQEIDRAAHHAAIAAEKAASALAFDRAATLYRVALRSERIDTAKRVELLGALGDALANAGRGSDAASVYVAAAALERKLDAAREYRRRAAEQLLRSGHIDEGLEVLKAVIQDLGMTLQPTQRRSLMSLALRRAQVRLRRLGFTPRPASEIAAETLARIDTLWSASMGLAMVETARGIDLQARHLLLALDAGEPHRVARALAMEAAYSATQGPGAAARTEDLIARAERIAGSLEQPMARDHALGLARYAAGVAALLSGRFLAARDASREAEVIFRERCTNAAWELASARVFHLWSVGVLGDLVELKRLVDENLREAEERGDRYAAANYRTGLANIAWLVADDPAGAKRQIDEVKKSWSQRGFHTQHYYQLVSETGLDLYLGEAERAHRRIEERWPDLVRSLMLRVAFIRVDALATRARTALALAKMRGSGAGPLLEAAEEDAARILKDNVPWSDAIAHKIMGGVAMAKRERSRAVSLYAQAVEGFERTHMMLYAAIAKYRLGEAIEGSTGREKMNAAESWFASQRVKKPAAIVAMIAP